MLITDKCVKCKCDFPKDSENPFNKDGEDYCPTCTDLYLDALNDGDDKGEHE